MSFKVSAIEVTQQLPSTIFSVRKKVTLSERVAIAITEILKSKSYKNSFVYQHQYRLNKVSLYSFKLYRMTLLL